MRTVKDLHSLALTGPVGNRLVEVVAGCLCLLLLCVTAPVLWWKRRLGEPPAAGTGDRRVVAGLMLGLGALFPLTGLSMAVALVGEWVLGRLRSVRS
ncbi:hypothetical protein NUH86_21430 [Sphingobium sp. JS3065]|uniref:hypothetical protein n=1 Tax=Sphingobium sp. JS3065 TaxID=2970925 RepID=UPI0022653F37|nr:hypothetical protein [Sphingobium sp. JS3065]UZW57282.1 hypothetical protein NUH86_21430 [Sphingobium sp. JS3065]